jgi:hypothetical protein
MDLELLLKFSFGAEPKGLYDHSVRALRLSGITDLSVLVRHDTMISCPAPGAAGTRPLGFEEKTNDDPVAR